MGLFGQGWGKEATEVHGKEHVKAINSGKIYLSFASTVAGFTNIKVGVFEAAACGSCIITSYFPEMSHYFNYGTEIIGYTDETMLMSAIQTYVKDSTLRTWIGDNAHRRVIQEHTWAHRWSKVMNDIQKITHVKNI